ncbi:MAG: hypothetical protein HFE91_03915 [Acutalibacter sp.]|jgi:hypothetical protein|nr:MULTISPECIES: hypothetical protein [unclassified Acutalibacter]MCI9224596.1 hypothetical protein [Acutalibacter sp.]
MCMNKYIPTEMYPYGSYDRETALRLAAQERFDMMVEKCLKNKTERRALK